MSSLPDGLLAIAPGFRLQWEETQSAYVLLYPEGMVKLNPSAAEILKRCDGSRRVDAIVADLQHQFAGIDLAADVCEFLEVAHARGWIQSR
jgi:pyrroloquinoline quinone biosynthesis protein D